MTITINLPLHPWGTHACPRSITVRIRPDGNTDVAELVSVSAEPCGVCGEGGALWQGAAVAAVQTAIDRGRLVEFIDENC